MNALWARFDGPAAVRRVSERLELAQTRPPADPSQWGETVLSAADVVVVYRYVLEDLPEPDRALLLDALAAAPPVAADGFDQVFGLLAAFADREPAVKQGWMCCQRAKIRLHSAGLVGPEGRYVVALLSAQPAELGWVGTRKSLTEAAGTLREAL